MNPLNANYYFPGYEGITNRQIFKSVVFHCVVIGFFLINAYFFPSEDLNIESAIRVDIVGLPEKFKNLPPPNPIEEVAAPPASKSKAEAEPQPEAIDLQAKKKAADLERRKAQQKALEKLKALDTISELEKAEADESKKAGAVAGNVQNQGNALTGILQNQISTYITGIRDLVNSNWTKPKWMEDATLRAEAIVFIDARGVVTKRQILKTSGNSSFDDSILSAIDASSPFPAPPGSLAGVFKNKGFTLGFPE